MYTLSREPAEAPDALTRCSIVQPGGIQSGNWSASTAAAAGEAVDLTGLEFPLEEGPADFLSEIGGGEAMTTGSTVKEVPITVGLGSMNAPGLRSGSGWKSSRSITLTELSSSMREKEESEKGREINCWGFRKLSCKCIGYEIELRSIIIIKRVFSGNVEENAKEKEELDWTRDTRWLLSLDFPIYSYHFILFFFTFFIFWRDWLFQICTHTVTRLSCFVLVSTNGMDQFIPRWVLC